MNRHSLFFTLTVSFFISCFFVILSYFLLLEELNKRSQFEHSRQYQPIMRLLRHEKNIEKAMHILTSLGYSIVSDKKLINKLTTKEHKNFIQKGFYKNKKHSFQILQYEEDIFLKITRQGKTFLIKDTFEEKTNFRLYLHVAFALIFVVLILSFFMTLKKLYPLKILQQKIKHLGEEKYDSSLVLSHKKDEVSILWNEFVKSTKKLQQIKKARNVFLRNIFHELKTPITKGKFLLELKNSEETKGKLQAIFTRLNSLINDFASIEMASSKIQNTQKQNYYIADIIDNAQDMLLADDDSLHIKVESQKINVNFKLFSIALKNLIDNALKYSPDHKATIYNKKENIIITNKGEKLTQNIEKYYQPYENTDSMKQDSFGLGMYIVFNLLKANGYTLEYLHVNGINYFTCKKLKTCQNQKI